MDKGNGGGDIAVRGAWPIGVATADGTLTIELADGAVATSGRDRRSWKHGKDERHHIIDPANGAPAVGDLRRVSVVAPTAADAEVDTLRTSEKCPSTSLTTTPMKPMLLPAGSVAPTDIETTAWFPLGTGTVCNNASCPPVVSATRWRLRRFSSPRVSVTLALRFPPSRLAPSTVKVGEPVSGFVRTGRTV